MAKIPKLPPLLANKIYKSGQTRGADDDVIFQNRVGRNSTALIPYSSFDLIFNSESSVDFEKGFIVLIKPEEYFDTPGFSDLLANKGIVLGENAILFYETRSQWNKYNPDELGLTHPTTRVSPLGGTFAARVPSLTSSEAEKISRGYNTNKLKGAGIRVYEYAPQEVIAKSRIQLEFLFWSCENSKAVAKFMGMTEEDIDARIASNSAAASDLNLDDLNELRNARILNENGNTICPLCLKPLSANGFFNKVLQADGRDVPDLTVTELNLFHIRELRVGEYNHRPYNLGWGHHHCNVVVKDAGIVETLMWMEEVVEYNKSLGHLDNQLVK